MLVATICSALLLLVPEVIAPAPEGDFRFTDVHIWRYSEGRGERIPAFSAALENRTGKEWTEARFRVHALCAEGERVYDLKLANVRRGAQKVNETIFNSIGVLAACEEKEVRVEFAGGTPAAPASYVVLGFAQEFQGSGWTTALEGILDHRRPTQYRSTTHPTYWRDGGDKLLERGGAEPVAFFRFRVEPGEFGLAGFTLSHDDQDSGLLARFLRFYLLDAGKTTYLGVFRLFHGQGAEAGVRMEFDDDAYEQLRSMPGLAGLEKGRAYRPMLQGTFTLGK